MYLRKNILISSLAFIVLSAALTITLALMSEYKYNVVTYIGDAEHKKQLQEDLDIEDKYFLLTPGLYLNFKLKNLEYVDSVSINRVLPNKVTIQYSSRLPIFCDDNSMYFENSSLEKDVNNQGVCLNIPIIQDYESFEDYQGFVSEYRKLGIDFRYNLSEVEEIDNYYQFTMKDGLVIKVYLNDFQKLNNFDEYQPIDLKLDLRPKYS